MMNDGLLGTLHLPVYPGPIHRSGAFAPVPDSLTDIHFRLKGLCRGMKDLSLPTSKLYHCLVRWISNQVGSSSVFNAFFGISRSLSISHFPLSGCRPRFCDDANAT